jgi:hypothetical protein
MRKWLLRSKASLSSLAALALDIGHVLSFLILLELCRTLTACRNRSDQQIRSAEKQRDYKNQSAEIYVNHRFLQPFWCNPFIPPHSAQFLADRLFLSTAVAVCGTLALAEGFAVLLPAGMFHVVFRHFRLGHRVGKRVGKRSCSAIHSCPHSSQWQTVRCTRLIGTMYHRWHDVPKLEFGF